MDFDQNDVQSAALCAWKEARGEGADGMRAVLHVLANRANNAYHSFGATIHDVIYGKNQFTSMSVPSDPEFNLQPAPGDEQFSFAFGAAPGVLDGTDDDVTNGADYYANMHEIPTDGWFYKNIVLSKNHPITAQIGHHTFFA